jgi:hypothetical protein
MIGILIIAFVVIVCYSFEESSYNEKHKCDEIEFREKKLK